MYLTICHDSYDSTSIYILKKSLEEKGFIVLDNEILEIDNNRQINIQAYFQLRKRSPNNSYVYYLHSKMIENKVQEIEKSDIVLFYNEFEHKISYLMFFYLSISWGLLKKIYLWKQINKKLPFFNEIFPLDIPVINQDINKLSIPISKEKYKNIITIEPSFTSSTINDENKTKRPLLIKKPLKK